MKTKSIALLCASVLVLFLVISTVSAALVIVGSNTVTITESSNIATFTLNNTGAGMVSVTLTESEADFTYTQTNTKSADTFNLNSNETVIVTITATENLDDLDFGTQNIKMLATANDSTEVTMTVVSEGDACKYEDKDDLRIDNIEFTNNGKFGDDTEWLPFDEINVEFTLENSASDDIENIELEWALYDSNGNEILSDSIDSDEYDDTLDRNDEMDVSFTFKLDDNIEDLEDAKYTFVIIATGEVQDNDVYDTCTSESEKVDVVIEDDLVTLSDIKIPQTASCGDEITLIADVWNIGSDSQKDVKIIISEGVLGIYEEIEMDKIKSLDSDKLNVKLSIPEGAKEQSYIIRMAVYDDDDVYEYDGEESEFSVNLKVEGCVVKKAIDVSAVAKSGGVAGKETVVEVTIVNTGSERSGFSLRTLGYESWADEASLDKINFFLEGGDTETILITLDVKKDAIGDNIFNLEISSDGEVVEMKSIIVPITEAKGFSLPSAFGNLSWSLIGIILLNIILIVAIIVVATRIIRKK